MDTQQIINVEMLKYISNYLRHIIIYIVSIIYNNIGTISAPALN